MKVKVFTELLNIDEYSADEVIISNPFRMRVKFDGKEISYANPMLAKIEREKT